MAKNICHFIPCDTDNRQLRTINFVLETQPQAFTGLKTEAVYKMYFVCAGHGVLHTLGKRSPLSPGDIFFTFPAEAFAIESEDSFAYMYISFLGSRGNQIMQTLSIDRHNCIFCGHSSLKSFWQNAIEMNSPLTDLASESVLLFTFSYLANAETVQKSLGKGQAWAKIKKYLDEHFTQRELSLASIGKALGYSEKYVSAVFHRHTGQSIVAYLHALRIQHGCTLIAQGFTSISDISLQSGFSDPQYFSKVFKKIIGVTPAQYIREQK